MTWFFGPRHLKPVRIMYFADYGRQVVDEPALERFRKSGLEDAIKREAKIRAPHGRWVDLPAPVFWPFRAATTVILFDEEWLPIPPNLFTTFGPTRPPLIAAVGQGDEVDVNDLLASGHVSRKDVSSALFFACNDSQTRLLRRLLDAGGDPNVYVNTRNEEEAYTPLMTAIGNHASAAVETLLAAGAKVNGPQGYAGETPLTLTARSSSDTERITALLLDAGADVNATNEYGLTALMDATHRQSAVVIEMLIKHGAVVDTRDHQGRTALQFAAERGNVDAVQVLLGSNPNVNAKDDRGNTPLSVAHNPQIAQLLREAGAK
jgi:ankyrin repeat protein